MENRTETIREIIYSNRRNRSVNQYSSLSTIENKPPGVGISCKEVSFVVEWQMQHPMPKYSGENK
jgi:hypothetical protein